MSEGEPAPTITKAELTEMIAGCRENTDEVVRMLGELRIPFKDYRARGEGVHGSGNHGAPPRELSSHTTMDSWGGATSSEEKTISTARYHVCFEPVGKAVYDEKKWWVVVLNKRDLVGQDVVAIEEEFYKSLG